MNDVHISRKVVVFTVALTLVGANAWMLTNKVFPPTVVLDPLSRDTSTGFQALILLCVALVAMRRPMLLRRWEFVSVPICCSFAGTAVMMLGVQTGNAFISTAGLDISVVSTAMVNVLLGCTLVQLDTGEIGMSVLVALILSYVLRYPLSCLEGVAVYAFYSAAPVAATFLVRSMAIQTIDAAQADESPVELAETNPFSFLPLDHQAFICLLLFRVAYGYALSFGEVGNSPLLTAPAGIAALLAVFAYAAIKHHLPKSDVLFYMAALLVVAGFLFVPGAQFVGFSVASNLLEAGSSCFTLLFWLVMGVLAKRNPRGALFLFAWSGFLLAIGVIAGAFLGRICNMLIAANSYTAAIIFTNVMALGYISYTMAILNLKGFSFSKTISSLEESPRVELKAEENAQDGDEILERIACEYGLTPRETEIFELLARGRTGTFIQQELTVSYNTVKTHVAHIYEKLGIHNHQGLIDYVELRAKEER